MRSVAFVTIGCKLNQFETEQMREAAEGLGYRSGSPGEQADVYVINTCTVTSKSDYRSRQAIRRALRLNPDATIVVTGCYAQVAADDITGIDGVDVVVGNAEKRDITDYIDLGKQSEPVVRVTDSSEMVAIDAARRLHGFGRYTRAFVKIQDGCDNCCSYCAVPLARGRSRSKSMEDIRTEIEVLVGEGYREIVLTGVHLGSYGRDLSPQASLARLLRDTAPVAGLDRVRLSSIEPTDFNAELIDVMADPAMKVCHHVHVPLQSGDDGILRLMGRPYDAGYYADVIGAIADRMPRCGIGADVMVGFPGEDDRAFENTRALLSSLPVTYLHVFSYSRRGGTPASLMPNQVDPLVKKRRSQILRQLGRKKSVAFREGLIGSRLNVLVLGAQEDGLATGLSDNYVKVYLRDVVDANTITSCEVLELKDGGVLATAVNSR